MKTWNCYWLIAFVFSISISVMAAMKPALNWDLIGYIAAAKYSEGLKGEDLLLSTYSEVKENTSGAVFKELTENTPYRAIVYHNANSLQQQMPFYTIRIAYIETMKWMHKLFNIPLIMTTYFISSFFAALFTLLLFYMFRLNSKWAIMFFPLVLLLSGVREIAGLSTPDAMASFFVILSLLALSSNSLLIVPLLTIIPFIRTDFIIFVTLVSACLLIKKQNYKAITSLFLSCSAYFYINNVSGNYGYLKTLYFTLVHNDPFPMSLITPTSISPFLDAYLDGFASFFGHKHFLIYLAYFIFWFKVIRPKKIQKLNEQVFIVLGFVTLHMVLFPAYYQRFFAWCAAVAGLQLVTWIYELKTKKTRDIN